MKLTAQQKEIIGHMANGLQTKEIAIIMRHTVATIETYKHNLFKRLKARNAVHLVSMAYQQGVLKSNTP